MTFKTIFLNAFIDPVRRKHTIFRIVESYLPSALVIGLFTHSWWTPFLAAGVTFGEYVLFEFILEPLKLTGNYWERGPRDDEKFLIP